MQRWRKFWTYWYREPGTWILRCFFQPAGFQQDLEAEQLSQRLLLMLRLLPVIFSCMYPLSLLIRVLLYIINPALYEGYHIHWDTFWQSDGLTFVLEDTIQALLGCVAGGLLGGIFGVVYGVVFGLSFCLGGGILSYSMSDMPVAITIGLILGVILGLTFNSTGAVKRSSVKGTTLATIIGVIASVVVGVAASIFPSYWVGLVAYWLPNSGTVGAIAGGVVGGLTAALLIFILGIIVKPHSARFNEAWAVGIRVGVAAAGALGVAVGLQVGAVGADWQSVYKALASGESNGLTTSIAFFGGYIFSYYRLPLYPFSALSVIRANQCSQRDPVHVFYYLKHCALHFDESVFLPLPYVRPLLLLAANQNMEAALEEIEFLFQERPQQSGAARVALLELVLFDLSMRSSLRDISRAHLRLSTMLPADIRQADHLMAKVFRHLQDASRDAVSYYSRLNWQARYDALESMKHTLKKIYPQDTFREAALNRQLEDVVRKWNTAAVREQEHMERTSRGPGQLENPYTPGLALELHDPLFVGRQDLANQLGEALRRNRRPTFFLTGERRMGKSTILKQLPDLLGSRYLPIFFDLQSIGIASSIAALLAAIAEGIHDLLTTRGMLVRPLTYEQLKEDQRENDAVVYHSFARWLNEVERVLERDDHVLLLAFDEFEKLEEAGKKGHIDLALLLDWMRSVIQNRPRLALLFSGVKTVSDMGANWAGYFVNVETLKVSFLQPEEARQLIIHPVPDFPGEQIFDEPVVREIMRVSHCHPFLTQAVCSIIITDLNASTRESAELADVTVAAKEVFQKWGEHYFRDLWDRTSTEQRRCLGAILASGASTLTQIQQASDLDTTVTQRTLQKLLKRDLLCREGERYCISMPIFAQWIEYHTANEGQADLGW
jgi:hypothetical protein